MTSKWRWVRGREVGRVSHPGRESGLVALNGHFSSIGQYAGSGEPPEVLGLLRFGDEHQPVDGSGFTGGEPLWVYAPCLEAGAGALHQTINQIPHGWDVLPPSGVNAGSPYHGTAKK